jgi:hypothetical protein
MPTLRKYVLYPSTEEYNYWNRASQTSSILTKVITNSINIYVSSKFILSVQLSLSARLINRETVFFSHNKSATVDL